MRDTEFFFGDWLECGEIRRWHFSDMVYQRVGFRALAELKRRFEDIRFPRRSTHSLVVELEFGDGQRQEVRLTLDHRDLFVTLPAEA